LAVWRAAWSAIPAVESSSRGDRQANFPDRQLMVLLSTLVLTLADEGGEGLIRIG
jgi:hypothetical protein